MTAEVSRQVVCDLWPLYASGDASADTRALVEAYLAADPAFAPAPVAPAPASVAADAVARPETTPEDAGTRRRLRVFLRLLQLALLFTALAFGRIVADTSWDVSPRHFIVTASIAAAFWIALLVGLLWSRAEVRLVTRR